jgi:hypothetical protein
VSESPKAGPSTAAPARNFTMTTEERVRALVAGPPAFALRRRRIEDLEAAIPRAIRAHEQRTGERVETERLPRGIARAFAELERLVAAHNAYYPIEARLPIDPHTGALVERGAPWRPMPAASIARLLAAAHDETR